MNAPTPRDRAIYHCVGHYMADVGERLLHDGYPVFHIGSVQPEEADVDGGGYVDFPAALSQQVGGAPPTCKELYFQWDADSGWSLVLDETTRWMGAGLTPDPERVSAFFLAAVLDFTKVGSEERPFYRTSGEDLDRLAEQLSRFARGGASFEERFRNARHAAAHQRACSAVLDEDALLLLPVRAGELAALSHLTQYLDLMYPLSELVDGLLHDLHARARPTTDKMLRDTAERHATARAYALRNRSS